MPYAGADANRDAQKWIPGRKIALRQNPNAGLAQPCFYGVLDLVAREVLGDSLGSQVFDVDPDSL